MKAIDMTGWVVAAVITGGLAGAGFQTSSPKYAIVNVDQVAQNSALNKANIALLAKDQSSRVGLLQFVSSNPVISGEDIASLRKLSLEPSPSAADQATLSGLKAKIEADEKKFLQLKAQKTLSSDDQLVLNDFDNRVKMVQKLLPQWDQEFSAQLRQEVSQDHAQVLTKVEATAAEIAKTQGCTILLDANSAPYCSIDLTSATLQAMDAQK